VAVSQIGADQFVLATEVVVSEPFATPAFSMTASIPVEWTPLR
jgi:hypothetical protein